MGDDRPRAPDGRLLTRSEIDRLVSDSLRLERQLDGLGHESLEQLLARTPYQPGPRPPAPRRAPRPAPPERALSRGARWLLIALAVLLVVVVGGAKFHRFTAASGAITGPKAPHFYSDGDYDFIATQPYHPDQPVGYNPCKPIGVDINYANATPDIRELLATTIRTINRVSGLDLVYGGASNKRRASMGITGRILISFDDITHDPSLVDAAGNGGSRWYTNTPGYTKYLVGGAVTLNTAEFNHYSWHDQSIVLSHELGHALGLAHAHGDEVMTPGNYRANSWGHGDLTGLAKLGALPCR